VPTNASEYPWKLLPQRMILLDLSQCSMRILTSCGAMIDAKVPLPTPGAPRNTKRLIPYVWGRRRASLVEAVANGPAPTAGWDKEI
jgi:hypothetical protein